MKKEKDSLVYILEGVCRVSVNSNTGKLIQVNPLSSKKGKNDTIKKTS